MQLPRTRALVPDLELVAETGSTNADLIARASAGPVPDRTVLVTTSQTAGRGRLGRTWIAPPGATLAISVLLNPDAAAFERIGWMPLLTGLAMQRAVRVLVPTREVSLKWPNDVLIGSRKVSGILGEIVPSGSGPRAVVLGAGLNLRLTEDELPVPTATSLTIEGADPGDLVDRALAGYLGELFGMLDGFASAGYDPAALLERVSAVCSTIGREVTVTRPAGDLHGTATGLDSDGRLVVRTEHGEVPVSAGDVTHVRPSAG